MLLSVGLINISDPNSTQKNCKSLCLFDSPQNGSGHLNEFDDTMSWAIGPFGENSPYSPWWVLVVVWGRAVWILAGFGAKVNE